MDPDLSARSDRLCQLASFYLHPCTLRILLSVRVSTSDGMLEDKGRMRLKRKEESGHDKRKIGCQLRVGFYHTPSMTGLTGVTGYTMGDEGDYPRAVGGFFQVGQETEDSERKK